MGAQRSRGLSASLNTSIIRASCAQPQGTIPSLYQKWQMQVVATVAADLRIVHILDSSLASAACKPTVCAQHDGVPLSQTGCRFAQASAVSVNHCALTTHILAVLRLLHRIALRHHTQHRLFTGLLHLARHNELVEDLR